MDVEVVKNNKKEIEFVIKGDMYTVTGFLQKKLLNNSDVEMASYYVEHPDENQVLFTVRTKKDDAKKALDKAIKDCKKEMSELNKKVLSSL